MRYMKWIGLLVAAVLILSCFMPWVVIESKDITVSGIDATGTNFGKPGYVNLLMTGLFLFFHLVPRVWAKRANLLVTAINLGWAVRNYFVISLCQAGDCPDKQTGIFLMVSSSFLMLISALFPDMELPDNKVNKSA
jgi:hypothetical protein